MAYRHVVFGLGATMRTAREILITGSVQGVGFRWTAKRIADSLGIDGWVRNNPDGSVGLALEGEEEDLNTYMDRLDSALGCYIAGMKSHEVKTGTNKDGFDIIR